jgi:thioredoxin
MIILDSSNFQKEILEFQGVSVVDFYADWCGPCRQLAPLLEKLDSNNQDSGVKFAKINIDNARDIAEKYGIRGIPTVIFFKNGKDVYKQVGIGSEELYRQVIQDTSSGKIEKENEGVKVFSTPTCPYCTMAKEYLRQKKIDFDEINVSEDRDWAMKMVSKSGQMGVPQVWINGQVVVGFDTNRIDLLLGING